MNRILQYFNPNTVRYWDRKYLGKTDRSAVKTDGAHLDIFMPIFRRSSTILDFGAGLGGNIHYLAGMLENRHFHLVDHSEVSLRFGREQLLGEKDNRGNSFSYHRDLTTVPGDTVDLVISIEVLEHITAYKAYLDQLWDKLRGGGILLVSVPVKGLRDRNREHVNKFTLGSMFRLLSGYGEMVHIAPRTYSKRSGRLSTAYFYVEKAAQ